MAIKVLTIDSEYESAKRLGYPTHTFLGDYAYKFDNDIIIRWGNSSLVYTREGSKYAEFKNVINSSKAIKQNCRKHECIKLLAQIVNVPTLWEKKVPTKVLAVVRPIEHSSGNGFSVEEGPFDVKPGTYATSFIKTDREYRVWFCGDKTMVGRRVKMESNPSEKYPCRAGWGYSFYDKISLELHHQTLMAAKKIGLEVGAADILYFNGKWLFLELNSAASVDHRLVREFYQAALEELIKKKEKELLNANEQQKTEQKTPETEQVVAETIPPVVVVRVEPVHPFPAVDQSVGQPDRADTAVSGDTTITQVATVTTDEAMSEISTNTTEQAVVSS